ncbi:TerC family protein [Saliterribacillus persicus]|uniref:YjbE family integral membrane protein n=1 Tax=Saliterribacillus persicus TaxID=930114 RepID=A0A368XAF8_9BACI|nr:TerC family protein [Saliterribacillus persicus]RCW64835.1 YjbE family integral membrane protein [Saliterribacillus persicus]
MQWFGLEDINLIMMLEVIAIDIVLSGDNALIIAMATKHLPQKQRNKAIAIGIVGAIMLRILFASGVVYLLHFPYIYFIAGILLLWVSYKLLINEESETKVKSQSKNLRQAILTIILADAIMSLDNVVALAGVAKGQLLLIAIGVVISIPIMIYGSKLIVKLLMKYRVLIYIGAAILAYTGASMITEDQQMKRLLLLDSFFLIVLIQIILTIAILATGYIENRTKQNLKETTD